MRVRNPDIAVVIIFQQLVFFCCLRIAFGVVIQKKICKIVRECIFVNGIFFVEKCLFEHFSEEV